MNNNADRQTALYHQLAELSKANNYIDPELFGKYAVKRGLRDLDGKGVLVGLTEIGDVHSYILDYVEIIPVPGRLMYRGYDLAHITHGYLK